MEDKHGFVQIKVPKISAVNGTVLLLRPAMKVPVGGILLPDSVKEIIAKDKDIEAGLKEPNWLTVLAIDDYSMPGVKAGDQIILDQGDVSPCMIDGNYCIVAGLHMIRLVKKVDDNNKVITMDVNDEIIESFMVDGSKLFNLEQLGNVTNGAKLAK